MKRKGKNIERMDNEYQNTVRGGINSTVLYHSRVATQLTISCIIQDKKSILNVPNTNNKRLR